MDERRNGSNGRSSRTQRPERARSRRCASRGRRKLLLVTAFLTLLAGCVPLPNVRPTTGPLEPSYRVAPAEVPSRFVWVEGFDEPSTPDRFDRQGTLRWALDEPADTVVVALAGLQGGAAQFGPLARRLVASVPGLQVWAVDRRANALEDRAVVSAAVREGDVEAVIDRYLGTPDAAPTFRRPDPEAYDFVKEWNLEVHLRDLDAVVREATATASRVVLLGHSLGASQAAVYLAWRGETGARGLDGLVLIDGAPGRTGALGREEGLRVLGVPVVLPTRRALTSGQATPWFTTGPGGEWFARRQGVALLGHLAPDATADTRVSDLPMSYRALAGIVHDDQYGALTSFSASLGEVTGAELDGNLTAALIGGRWALRAASVVGVSEGAERVEWTAGDPRYERSDIDEYLRDWAHPKVDMNEWYMPVAMLLDLAALEPDLTGLAGFDPMRSVTVPTLAIGSDRGLLRDVDAFAGYLDQRLGTPVSVTIVSGLTHADLLASDVNPVVPLLGRWLSLLGR